MGPTRTGAAVAVVAAARRAANTAAEAVVLLLTRWVRERLSPLVALSDALAQTTARVTTLQVATTTPVR